MTETVFIEKYASQLNDEQLQAVRSADGPVLLLAVPGSGKTTTLVTRLGYMIYVRGIAPETILTLTYTVAATKDMAKRYAAIFGEDIADRLEFRTINGICAKIIAAYGRRIGKTAFSLVTDDGQTAKLLTDIYLKYMEEYPTESDIKTVRTLITYSKNMMLSDQEIEKLGNDENIELFPIYRDYNEALRKMSLMDYDDQMIYAYKMLKGSKELLEYYRNIYRYICVDEAQDTSKIQHMIIGLLAGKTGNLFMVGDEDQSIYGFRAAYPEALLDFEKDHPGARVLVMDKNYRSNSKIVEISDYFIQKNEDRHPKHMKATRSSGDDINYINLSGRASQYNYLLKVADNPMRQTAVLYRDNESVLPLVDILERNGTPYHIKNMDMGFFTHRIVQDIVSIILFSFDLKNTDLFMKIYYKCQTYLKKKEAERLCRIAMAEDIDVLDAAENLQLLNGNVRGKCKGLHTHLVNMRYETPLKALNRIERYMGYGEYLERSNMDKGKLFILKRLAYNEQTLQGFIERLKYLQEVLRNKRPDYSAKFILSTIHSSKGLEYDEVYLMDVCDGVFPSNVPVISKHMPKQEKKELEEERRLFYVGMTRAKDRLNIFTYEAEESLFIRELRKPSKAQKTAITLKKKPVIKAKKAPDSDYPKELVIGQRVLQPKYGSGVITDVSVDEDEIPTKFSVEFESGNERVFMYPFAFSMGMKLV